MTIYQKATGKVEILNARERAPLAATEDMFLGDPELSLYGKKKIETQWSKMTSLLLNLDFHLVDYSVVTL